MPAASDAYVLLKHGLALPLAPVLLVLDLESRGFNAQMKAAGKSGARCMVLLGGDEWARGEVVVKDLADGSQTTVKRADLETVLHARLDAPKVVST